MKKILLICFIAMIFFVGCSQINLKEKELSATIFAMDTVMDIKIYSDDEQILQEAEDEIKRIENIMSRTNENSEIYKFNNNDIKILSEETRKLIKNSCEISERTNGAFDITITPMMDLWGFSDKNFRVPNDEEIKRELQKVDYKKIEINENGSFKKDENTKIDLGGIAKGYTSDRLMKLFRDNGVKSAIVSLGGNVQTLGKRDDSKQWRVAVQNPFQEGGNDYVGIISTNDEAIVTSGGYQRFFEENGKKYHHIIDTKSGYPAENGLVSVTVICKSGETADGLSTAIYVMGIDEAVRLWKESNDFEAVFVKDNGEIVITEGIEERFESEKSYEVIRKN